MDRYMDAFTIRRRRLQQLIRQKKRETGTGVAEVARRSGIRANHISAYASEHIRKNMGDEAARRIEAGCGLPHGWLDTPDDTVDVLELVARVLEEIPPEHWNPLTRRLVARVTELALKEGWDEPTLRGRVQEYLRLVG